ncbi:Uma2 family endonuclease [Mucilaginibacter sp. JRF]|uniref:Uma2 family endonuclease n=1 Tax=Mucilaginibacter sp. JRF TaxID=2780088 RepID=UPI0018814F5A|nr:Uma2 family endonuclease [Mucilaginibacter sp. JRF]MBE9585744.1 Uma2 family endonuclease [Mucilaginibacter sp. JRF]
MKHILDIPRNAMEVFNMLPEGTLCEVIDNVLYMSPSPTTNHQRILLDIASALKFNTTQAQTGEAFIAPCDVYLDGEQNVVQPDIIFVSNAKAGIIQKKGLYGAPDLVIEILSSNKSYDQEKKFELYERNAIPEYFIIDSETKQVWHYLLINNQYQEQTDQKHGQIIIDQLSLNINF